MVEEQTIELLNRFADQAGKSKKYSSETVEGTKRVLRYLDPELNDEERFSLETFKTNLEPIFSNFYRHNQAKYSSNSIRIYKRRIERLLEDFEKYGFDLEKIARWPSEIKPPRQKKLKDPKEDSLVPTTSSDVQAPDLRLGSNVNKIEIVLERSRKVTLLLPFDLTGPESHRIKNFIDASVLETKNQDA